MVGFSFFLVFGEGEGEDVCLGCCEDEVLLDGVSGGIPVHAVVCMWTGKYWTESEAKGRRREEETACDFSLFSIAIFSLFPVGVWRRSLDVIGNVVASLFLFCLQWSAAVAADSLSSPTGNKALCLP